MADLELALAKVGRHLCLAVACALISRRGPTVQETESRQRADAAAAAHADMTAVVAVKTISCHRFCAALRARAHFRLHPFAHAVFAHKNTRIRTCSVTRYACVFLTRAHKMLDDQNATIRRLKQELSAQHEAHGTAERGYGDALAELEVRLLSACVKTPFILTGTPRSCSLPRLCRQNAKRWLRNWKLPATKCTQSHRVRRTRPWRVSIAHVNAAVCNFQGEGERRTS